MNRNEAYLAGLYYALEKQGVDWRTVALMGGLGTVGAGIGALSSDDHPVRSGLIGAGLGAGVGTLPALIGRTDLVQRLVNAAKRVQHAAPKQVSREEEIADRILKRIDFGTHL